MSAIGDQLKRSRGSIAGRIRRLRVKLVINSVEPKLLRFYHPPETRTRLRMIDEKTTEVTMQELKEHHCRWPIGDPKHSDFRFCGMPRLKGRNTPYCQEHTTRAGSQYLNVRVDNPVA